jgi:hypothetical protein
MGSREPLGGGVRGTGREGRAEIYGGTTGLTCRGHQQMGRRCLLTYRDPPPPPKLLVELAMATMDSSEEQLPHACLSDTHSPHLCGRPHAINGCLHPNPLDVREEKGTNYHCSRRIRARSARKRGVVCYRDGRGEPGETRMTV